MVAGGPYRPPRTFGGNATPAAPVRLMGRKIALLRPANDNAVPHALRLRAATALIAALAGIGGLLLLYLT